MWAKVELLEGDSTKEREYRVFLPIPAEKERILVYLITAVEESGSGLISGLFKGFVQRGDERREAVHGDVRFHLVRIEEHHEKVSLCER